MRCSCLCVAWTEHSILRAEPYCRVLCLRLNIWVWMRASKHRVEFYFREAKTRNIRFKARDNGWLSSSSNWQRHSNKRWRAIWIWKRILNRQQILNCNWMSRKTRWPHIKRFFRFEADSGRYMSLSPSLSGSYKISILTINTAFKFQRQREQKTQTCSSSLERT